MNNLAFTYIFGAVACIWLGYLLRNNYNIFVTVITPIVVYSFIILAFYRDYKLVKYIRLNHPKFYEKHKERIGGKFWLKELKSELASLNDEFITTHIKKL